MLRRVLEILRLEGPAGLHRRVLMRLRWPGPIPSRYGPRFAANHCDGTFRMYVRGSYGTFYWDRLTSVPHPFVFLDIGANQGLYAIGAARNPNCLACHAFEPVPATYAYLQKNLRLNGVAEKVRAINAGIADRAGSAEIVMADGHSGGATMAASGPRGAGERKTIRIDLLDAAALERLIPAEAVPILVKIDVEGFEPVVIDQLLRTAFADRIAEIFLEIDEDWVDADALRRRLGEAGFAAFDQIGSGAHYDLLARRPGSATTAPLGA